MKLSTFNRVPLKGGETLRFKDASTFTPEDCVPAVVGVTQAGTLLELRQAAGFGIISLTASSPLGLRLSGPKCKGRLQDYIGGNRYLGADFRVVGDEVVLTRLNSGTRSISHQTPDDVIANPAFAVVEDVDYHRVVRNPLEALSEVEEDIRNCTALFLARKMRDRFPDFGIFPRLEAVGVDLGLATASN